MARNPTRTRTRTSPSSGRSPTGSRINSEPAGRNLDRSPARRAPPSGRGGPIHLTRLFLYAPPDVEDVAASFLGLELLGPGGAGGMKANLVMVGVEELVDRHHGLTLVGAGLADPLHFLESRTRGD